MPKKGKLLTSSLIIGTWLLIWTPCLWAMDAADGPDDIELLALTNIYEPVAFDHTLHVDVASCATCHHHTTGQPAEDENCLRCHKETGEADEVSCTACHPANPGRAEMVRASKDTGLFHIDRTGLKRAYHLNCLGCHREMDAPTGCQDCHSKKDGSGDLASIED